MQIEHIKVKITDVPFFLNDEFGEGAYAKFCRQSYQNFLTHGRITKDKSTQKALNKLWDCYKAARVMLFEENKIPKVPIIAIQNDKQPEIIANNSVMGAIADYLAESDFTFYLDGSDEYGGVITKIHSHYKPENAVVTPYLPMELVRADRYSLDLLKYVKDLASEYCTEWQLQNGALVPVYEAPIPTDDCLANYPFIAGFGEIRKEIVLPHWEEDQIFSFYQRYRSIRYNNF